MCGIAYVMRLDGKPAQKQLLKIYTKQKDRGSEGFGYITIDKAQKMKGFKRFQHEKEMREHLSKSASEHILFHHRFPTSAINVPETAHPILVSHKELKYDYYVTHNGVLSNDAALRRDHEKLGYPYTTEISAEYRTKKGKVFYGKISWNDSEALAIELARNIEGLQELTRAKGTIAYIVLQVGKANKKVENVFFGTNGGNPLTLTQSPQGVVIASEGGRAVIDDVCFKLDPKAQTLEPYARVQMESYYARPVGYIQSPYSYGGYDGGYDGASDYNPKGTSGNVSEIENEIEALSQQIADCKADIELSVSDGDTDAEQELAIELYGLEKEMLKLQKDYENASIPF